MNKKIGLFIFIVLVTLFCIFALGEGPRHWHSVPSQKLEFENIYQDLRDKGLTVNGDKKCIDDPTFCVDTDKNSVVISSLTINTFFQGKGTATNDNAGLGYIGQFVSSFNVTTTNFPTSEQFGNGAAISLTAGDWDVSANLYFILNSAASTSFILGVSTTSGNSNAGLSFGNGTGLTTTSTGGFSFQEMQLTTPVLRISIANTTTYYVKVYSKYSSGNPQYRCNIRARRVR